MLPRSASVNASPSHRPRLQPFVAQRMYAAWLELVRSEIVRSELVRSEFDVRDSEAADLTIFQAPFARRIGMSARADLLRTFCHRYEC